MNNGTLGEYLLTDDQVETFHEQGFVVCRQFIPPDMVEELRLGYDAATRGEIEAWKNSWAPGKANARDAAGRKVASGVYIYRLTVGSGTDLFVDTKKLVLIR